jgi:metal-responsive CopG/Arc/MetJ family transcriptional regulator
VFPHAYMTHMALSARKRITTIILDAQTDRLLGAVARAHGVSRSEFIRAQLRRALEQYRPHPKPRSAGVVRQLRERGDERELFRTLER